MSLDCYNIYIILLCILGFNFIILTRLFGDYESLRSGHARDGMVDMTGGVGQRLELEEAKSNLVSKTTVCKELQEAFRYGSLMSASIVVGS